jgi:hypothetical protein
MTFRFSHDMRAAQLVTVTPQTICGGATIVTAVALDGSFDPCNPSLCVGGQSQLMGRWNMDGTAVSPFEFTAYPHIEYYIVVDCAAGSEGSFNLTVECSWVAPDLDGLGLPPL